ncbi:MAG TPA: glutathione S-transferase N-terminal domain-containing protein [Solirubrobacterales bacterium]|nr:glutathione S-transferase N-terminal domain-containing protein [Solirubrobacterales bacterium]
MATTLYVIPGSHPSWKARLALELKGIEYRRVDLMPVISRGVVRALRFGGATVPALKIDGRRVQGSREIARELDRLVPEPPLYPGDPNLRAEVEAAERWGEKELQPVARRVVWNAFRRDRSALASFARGARLGIPVGIAVRTSAPIVALSVRIHAASDDHVRADLAALPGMLNRIDDWIADGVLGDPDPNAADLQIATSIRLLMTLDDVRPAVESRPCGELALRIVPEFPGRIPPLLPEAWLRPLNDSTAVRGRGAR